MAPSSPTALSDSPLGSAGRKETLADRARRFIGKNLDDVADETPASSEGAPSKRGPPKTAPPTRRREQILQAQRTHRQRTQGYIRELEKEILRLRELESSLTERNQQLSSEVQSLKQALQDSNTIFTSTGSNIASSDLSYLTPEGFSYLTLGDIDPTAPVLVDLTELDKIDPSVGCASTVALELLIPYETPKPTLSELSFLQNDPSVLNPQAAVNFVLELEATCLPHIKRRYLQGLPQPSSDVIPDFNGGEAHIFNATISLLNGKWDENPIAHPFEVPQSDLNDVFQSNLSLDFGCDVTPMQIWVNLTRIAARHFINEAILRALTDEYKRYSRCNGFGTVVERTTASLVLGYFFPGEEFLNCW